MASAETLEETTNWALRSSVSLQSETAKHDAAAARLRASIDAFMPSIAYVQERILSSKIAYSPDITAAASVGTLGQSTVVTNQPNSRGFVATLPLFDGLKRFNNMQAASVGVEAVRYLQLDKRQQVVLDAANAYLAVLRDRRIVELRKKQLQSLTEIAHRTQVRYSVHDTTLAEVFVSKSRVTAVEAQIEQALSDLESSKVEYQRITDAQPGILREPNVPNDLVPKSVEEFQRCMLESNPKMRAAQLEARIAGYNAKAAVADLLPQVNLYAQQIRQTDVTEAVPRVTDTTVKIQLRMPIYEPGAVARINEADAVARQKHWDDVDSRKQGLASATSLYLRRASIFGQIARTTERIKQVQKAVDSFKIEQEAGLRTVIDVLNTQAELTETQIARVNLEYMRDSQTFTLVAALARLTPPAPDAVPGGASILQLARLTR